MLVVIDLAGARAAEDLELELDRAVVVVDVEVGWDVQLCLLCIFAVHLGADVLLQVLILRYQASRQNVHDDVGLAHVNQHVIFERL